MTSRSNQTVGKNRGPIPQEAKAILSVATTFSTGPSLPASPTGTSVKQPVSRLDMRGNRNTPEFRGHTVASFVRAQGKRLPRSCIRTVCTHNNRPVSSGGIGSSLNVGYAPAIRCLSREPFSIQGVDRIYLYSSVKVGRVREATEFLLHSLREN